MLLKFYTFPNSATYAAHLIIFYSCFMTAIMFGVQRKLWGSSLCNVPLRPSLLSVRSNVLPSIPFVNITSLYPSRKVGNQVSHSYRTTSKSTLLYSAKALLNKTAYAPVAERSTLLKGKQCFQYN